MRIIEDFGVDIVDHYQNPYGEIYFNNINKNFLTINPNKTIQISKNYTNIFPSFASGTTLDLARLLQRWDKKNIITKFLNLEI